MTTATGDVFQEVQDMCTTIPDDGTKTTSQFTTTLLSFVKALFPSKSQMLIDAQLDCQKTQNRINVLIGATDSYQSCVVDINVDQGSDGEEALTQVAASHMQKVLQRQSSLTTGKSIATIWLALFYSCCEASVVDKAIISERCHDAPINRWRRYKRAASFDSRKIVILFSILSSMGTLVLIYLTLRVRLNSAE